MPTDVIMPQMGESIFEGTITKWLKRAGESVSKDEPLFEISTDKVDAEIPSPVAGILTEIKVAEGATVQVNTVVAVVAQSGDAAAEPAATTQPAAVAEVPSGAGVDVVMPQMGESIFEGTITQWRKKVGDTVAKDEPLFEISTDKVDAEIPSPVAGILTEIKVPQGATVQVNVVVATIGGSAPAAAAPPAEPAPAKPAPPPVAILQEPAVHSGQRLRSSPLVRRIARDNNLNLAAIPGTGAAGRITKDDVLLYLSKPKPADPPASALQSSLAGTVQPLSKMRAIIAQRMVESMAISPHVHNVYKVDMTRIVRLRERVKSRFEQQHGIKFTYMPFIASAVIETLGKHPIVNASLIEGAIHYHRHVHLGMAVALEWGLIVPVVKQAETRSFADLAGTLADLALRARGKKLLPDEASGSTFTITNSGIFGDEFGTPIINQPESAILAIGALRKEPVVVTDAEGNDSIGIRSIQHLCLGFDHRIIDGADAGRFMSDLKKTLENWNEEIG